VTLLVTARTDLGQIAGKVLSYSPDSATSPTPRVLSPGSQTPRDLPCLKPPDLNRAALALASEFGKRGEAGDSVSGLAPVW